MPASPPAPAVPTPSSMVTACPSPPYRSGCRARGLGGGGLSGRLRLAQVLAALRVRLGALAGLAATRRRGDSRGQLARGHQERGVRDHPVVGPDGEALGVPVAHQGLPGPRLGPAAALAQRLHQLGQLRRGGDVADEHPAGHQRPLDHVEGLPRGQHVQDDPVEAGLLALRDVADVQVPRRGAARRRTPRRCAGRSGRSRRAARTSAARPRCRRRAAASSSARRSRRRPRAPSRRGRCRPSRRSAPSPSGRSPGRRAAWTARSPTAAAAGPGTRCRHRRWSPRCRRAARSARRAPGCRGGCGTPCRAPASRCASGPWGRSAGPGRRAGTAPGARVSVPGWRGRRRRWRELRSRCHLPVGFEQLCQVRDVQNADDIFA